jgi:hypothetical protein
MKGERKKRNKEGNIADVYTEREENEKEKEKRKQTEQMEEFFVSFTC